MLNENTTTNQGGELPPLPPYEPSEQERLGECYLLLARIASDIRPIVGGYRELCRDLLARHGVAHREMANASSTPSAGHHVSQRTATA